MSTKTNLNDFPAEVDDTKYSMQTHMIYGKNISSKWDYSHHVVAPLSSSVIFKLDSVERGAEGFLEFANSKQFGDDFTPIYIYDRFGEPNKDLLEENLAYVEKGEKAVPLPQGWEPYQLFLVFLQKQEMR